MLLPRNVKGMSATPVEVNYDSDNTEHFQHNRAGGGQGLIAAQAAPYANDAEKETKSFQIKEMVKKIFNKERQRQQLQHST